MMLRYLPRLIRKKGLPIHLIYQCTYRCNSRCKSCFLQEEIKASDVKKELKLDEIQKLSSDLKNILWLQIGGGEPFLREDIVDICRVFKKADTISIATNGVNTELIERRLKEILKNIDSRFLLVLSLDGLQEHHDAIRGVPGNFAKVNETYKRISKLRDKYKNFIISVNTVIMPENAKKLNEIIRYVRNSLRLNMHSFEFIRGRAGATIPVMPEFHEIDEISSILKQNISSYGYGRGWRAQFLKKAKLYEHDLIIRTLCERKKQIDCCAGRLSAVINPYGDVFACELIEDKIGNIRDYAYDFEKLWLSDNAQKIREKIKDCFCTHSCFNLMNSLFNLSSISNMILR